MHIIGHWELFGAISVCPFCLLIVFVKSDKKPLTWPHRTKTGQRVSLCQKTKKPLPSGQDGGAKGASDC
jgi:hypothetical protein